MWSLVINNSTVQETSLVQSTKWCTWPNGCCPFSLLIFPSPSQWVFPLPSEWHAGNVLYSQYSGSWNVTLCMLYRYMFTLGGIKRSILDPKVIWMCHGNTSTNGCTISLQDTYHSVIRSSEKGERSTEKRNLNPSSARFKKIKWYIKYLKISVAACWDVSVCAAKASVAFAKRVRMMKGKNLLPKH